MVYFVVGYTGQLGYLVKTMIKISITQIDFGASLLPGWRADKGGPVPDCQPDPQHPMPSSPAARQETIL